MNTREQVTGATIGYTAAFGYDQHGFPTSTVCGPLQDYRYSFTPETGNINSRQNFLRSKSESFAYDNLDRLIDSFWGGVKAFGVGAGGGALVAATGGAALTALGGGATAVGGGGFIAGVLSTGIIYGF